VIEAGFGELPQSVQGDADCRGDEIGVKVGGMRRCHDRDEIAPRTRLAAGEMHLQDAERRGLLAAPEAVTPATAAYLEAEGAVAARLRAVISVASCGRSKSLREFFLRADLFSCFFGPVPPEIEQGSLATRKSLTPTSRTTSEAFRTPNF
jgi:hypothetical protein